MKYLHKKSGSSPQNKKPTPKTLVAVADQRENHLKSLVKSACQRFVSVFARHFLLLATDRNWKATSKRLSWNGITPRKWTYRWSNWLRRLEKADASVALSTETHRSRRTSWSSRSSWSTGSSRTSIRHRTPTAETAATHSHSHAPHAHRRKSSHGVSERSRRSTSAEAGVHHWTRSSTTHRTLK